MKWLHILKAFFAGYVGVFIGIFFFFVVGNFLFHNFFKPYVVLSGSMEPSVMTGSIVLSQPQTSYQVGDIITFGANGSKKEFVTHRIVDKTAEGFITKGDANEDQDAWVVSPSHINGTVRVTFPYAGFVIDYAKKPQGFILLVIVPATIIVYEELKSIWKEILSLFKKKKNKKVGPLELNYDLNSTQQQKLNSILGIAPEPVLAFNPPENNFVKFAVIIPVIGVSFLIAFSVSSAFFSDTEANIGNVLGAASSFASPTPVATPQTQAVTLVINEVLPDSSCIQGQTEAQWIEVYNGFPNTVNLKNFKITDGTNIIDLVTANTNVPAGSFALLAHNQAIWTQCYDDNNAITANLGGQLNIDTGLLQLLDSQNVVIDTVKWGGAEVHQPSQDQSIERDPDGRDTATGTSFSDLDFVLRTTPFPGI